MIPHFLTYYPPITHRPPRYFSSPPLICSDPWKVLSLLDSKWLLGNIKSPPLHGFLTVNIKCSWVLEVQTPAENSVCIQVLKIKPKKSSRGNVPYHRESGLVGMTCLTITIHPFSLNFKTIRPRLGPSCRLALRTNLK